MERDRNVFNLFGGRDDENSDSDIDIGHHDSSDEFSETESETSSESSSNSGSDSENENVPAEANGGGERWIKNDRTDIPARDFTGPEPGPTSVMDPEANEWDFVELLFSDHLLDLIVTQTNLYATQKIAVKPDPNWQPVTKEEIRAWLGIRVYMSILYVSSSLFLVY